MPVDASFIKAPVSVPKLSGFDKSHHNLLTSMPGTITPILIDELIPGAKVNLNLALSASLPPLASDTFMKCSVKVEAFFVPFRLLSGAFESWFTNEPKEYYDYSLDPDDWFTEAIGALPAFGNFNSTSAAALASAGYFDSGSLADYLGFRPNNPASAISSFVFTLMPFLAYHKVYNDWYRNTLVQREAFMPPAAFGGTPGPGVPVNGSAMAGTMPYVFTNPLVPNWVVDIAENLTLADGVNVFALRQRNFGLDYFTTATPTAQQGSAEVVSFNTSGSTGQFSIAALRAANSMQQFKERNNLAGNLYVEQLYARYGVRPSDGVAQRALFVGSAEYECYSRGIYQTAEASVGSSQNPFDTTSAAQFGSARASGNSHITEFSVSEPGYFMVMATLVPRASYATGINRRFWHYSAAGSIADLANPILQNVGPQPIYQSELDGNAGVGVFGYTDRYAEFKAMDDEVHGLIRDGESLQSFALQRSFTPGNPPSINSAFLKIPATFLDQVTAVQGTVSQYGCWMDMYFDYKVAQPLSKYALPSLQDPAYEHGRTIVINRGGSKL